MAALEATDSVADAIEGEWKTLSSVMIRDSIFSFAPVVLL